ncbi:BON domain-containing protein [Paraburkholderia sp. BL23I1N1]|uniref:CBS domain-containing protein n=1 Tax=Paraburkholderia sp. BL23I1N1 TaxID=1938802 RepID=UPI000E759BC4|nr:CBS domain-containing protein [Paraburkholderia sp. BL23I1N1]RKE37960.1 BON domain-containing protein [Paraburkholderia sp. BL23I1N1]
MHAIDVMTPAVVVTAPEMTVQAAAKRLADNHISGMPVVDAGGQVIGMISEGDLLHRTEIDTDADAEGKRRSWWLDFFASTRELASTYVKEHARTVRDVMSDKVVSVAEDTPLADIADLLERRRIKRVPVMRDGKLVGIVSRANLIRALASVPADALPVASGDQQIHDAIVRELSNHRWAQPSQNVIVKQGIVHLWAVVQSEEERRAICVAAQSVHGVKEVRSYIEFPMALPAM